MCCLSDTRRPQNLNKCVYMEKLIRRGRRTIHLFDIRTADLVEHGYDSRSVCARNFLEERDLEMDPYTDPDTDLGPSSDTASKWIRHGRSSDSGYRVSVTLQERTQTRTQTRNVTLI